MYKLYQRLFPEEQPEAPPEEEDDGKKKKKKGGLFGKTKEEYEFGNTPIPGGDATLARIYHALAQRRALALQDALLNKCSPDDLSEAEDHIKIQLAPQGSGAAETSSVKLLWFANEKDMDASIDEQTKKPIEIMPENIAEVCA